MTFEKALNKATEMAKKELKVFYMIGKDKNDKNYKVVHNPIGKYIFGRTFKTETEKISFRFIF